VQGLANGLTAAADGLVASTDPVQPGNTDVSYLYSIAVPRSGWGMNLPVVYPTAKVEVLVDPGLTLAGPGLKFRQSVTIGKQRYKDYQGSGLAPGTSLTADIAPAGFTSPTLYLGLGALVVLVVATAFGLPRLLRRRRRPAPEAAPTDVAAARVAGAPAEVPGSRQELIEEIARPRRGPRRRQPRGGRVRSAAGRPEATPRRPHHRRLSSRVRTVRRVRGWAGQQRCFPRPMIEVRRLTRRFGPARALSGIDLG